MRKQQVSNFLSWRVFLFPLLAVLLAVIPAYAGAAEMGTVSGTVELEGGLLLPGVTVEAQSGELEGNRTTTSDENGSFQFKDLPAGKYRFTFQLEGMKTILLENIKVKAGKNVELHPLMKVAALREEVVIMGQREKQEPPADQTKVAEGQAAGTHKDGDVASILFPRLLEKKEPGYPQEALAKGLEGDVLIGAVIGGDGLLHDMQIVVGKYGSLVKASLDALEGWRYQPWVINGKPTPTDVMIKMTFKLQAK